MIEYDKRYTLGVSMEKITEKFGLFDLMVTTFPGAYFLLLFKNLTHYFIFTLSTFQTQNSYILDSLYIINYELRIPRTVFELVAFSFLSYFVGFVLQGLTSWVKHHLVFSHGKPHHLLFDSKKGPLDKFQIEHFTPTFKRLYSFNKVSSLSVQEQQSISKCIFHKINAMCQKSNIANKYVKLIVLANMSYNLFVANSALLVLVIAFYFVLFSLKLFHLRIAIHIIALTLSISTIVFFKQAVHFNKRWIVNLLYAYEAET